MLITSNYWRLSVLICLVLLQAYEVKAQCKQSYSWASWQNFTGRQATGTIVVDKKTVNVTMTTNYDFFSANEIYRLDRFSGFSDYKDIPNATVPGTEWAKGVGVTTTMCFSEPVTNPILLYSSLGRANPDDYQKVTLKFSEPYTLIYDAGGTTFIDAYSLSGLEGNAIISFPGTFSCLTIYSDGTEFNTNLNWALQPQPFPITISDAKGCDKVTLTAQGGTKYKWNGGDTPNSAINTVRTSGVYSVTATDQNGCTSVAQKNVTVTPNATLTSTVSKTICQGESYLGYQSSGTYTNVFKTPAGCDSIQTVNLNVLPAGFCGATIFAPDLFTPNGDQINDLFNVVVVDGTPIRLTIYDRWGAVIFSEENSNPRWDGTYKGDKCLTGIYSYVLKYKVLSNDEIREYRNKLTLLR